MEKQNSLRTPVIFLTAAFVMVYLLIDIPHLKTEINMRQEKIELINLNTNAQVDISKYPDL